MLLMGLRGCLHANAGVRAAVVVEADEAGDPLLCVTDCLEAPLTVDDFSLEGHLSGLHDVRGGISSNCCAK